ncbi:hypothetical protein [Micromonospora nigra]|uniref:hypothetical protein n=1 Tax=Micromonospora nigra TaxID=145857 RepID=UPI000A798076|nr:hypothetical protein [Micromonospora nigra]
MEEAYQAWASGPSRAAHASAPGEQQRPPVASGATLLEFEVVQQVTPARDRS